MIRIQNDKIPDEMSYSIICKHVNIGLRIHFLFFLAYVFHIFEKDLLSGTMHIQNFRRYRTDMIPREIPTDNLPFLIKSLYNKIVDANEYIIPSREDILLLRAVYALERKYTRSGLIPWQRIIPNSRDTVIARYMAADPGKSVEDIEKIISKYEDIRCYSDLF